jgi:hypothetical protein
MSALPAGYTTPVCLLFGSTDSIETASTVCEGADGMRTGRENLPSATECTANPKLPDLGSNPANYGTSFPRHTLCTVGKIG